MKISVALTTYNGERYIESQLSSIANQVLAVGEVIICDDGSTDNTKQIVLDFISKNGLSNWHFYENEKQLGFKKNFLSAIQKTTGDIIFLCDQDDIWLANKTKIMTEFLSNVPDACVVASSFDFIDGNDLPIEKSEDKNTSNHSLIGFRVEQGQYCAIDLKTVMHSNISPGCTLAITRDIADKFTATSQSELPHDWELCLLASKNNSLYFLNEVLSFYRIHQSNTLGLKGENSSRLAIAQSKASAAKAVSLYDSDTALFNMYNARAKAIKEKSISAVLKLNFNSLYRKFLSLHERIGDIVYTIKR